MSAKTIAVLTAHALNVAYRLAVLGTCAYVVFGLGYSGWWFLLALLLL